MIQGYKRNGRRNKLNYKQHGPSAIGQKNFKSPWVIINQNIDRNIQTKLKETEELSCCQIRHP